jgi:hypothetical protein
MSIRLAATTAGPTVWWPVAGFSPESRDIEARLEEIRKDRRTPISFSWRESLQDELTGITRSCSDAGWDGYDAEPVLVEAETAGRRLIEALPEFIAVPNVVPEPSGRIALEWCAEGQKRFLLSISGTTLRYAGIFGGSKEYGEERFFDVLPPKIHGILTSHFPQA